MSLSRRLATLLAPRPPITVSVELPDTSAAELLLRGAAFLGRLASRDIGWREQGGTLVVLTVRPSELEELRALCRAFEESVHERLTPSAARRRHPESSGH